MFDQFSGTVFKIGQRQGTRGMNVENFMKTMGAGSSGEVFKPIDPMEDVQNGTDATGAYFEALENANRFGMEMAAKGINVLKPNSRNPQSVTAARHMQSLMRSVQQQGSGLVVGQQMAKQYATERLKSGVAQKKPMIDPNGFSGPTTASDMENLVNMNPVIEQAKKASEQIDKHAKNYGTHAERDAVNLTIEEQKQGLLDMKAKFTELGFPEDQVNAIIDNAYNSIGQASSGNKDVEDLKLKKRGIDIRAFDAASKDKKRKADIKKASGKKSAKSVMFRKETIERIQNGDLGAAGVLVGSKNGSWTVTDVEYSQGGDLKEKTGIDEEGNDIYANTGNAAENTLTLTQVNASGKKRKVEIPMGESSGGAFQELNNWINLVPDQENFSVEDLSEDFSDLTEEEKRKEGLGTKKKTKSQSGGWKIPAKR